MTFDPSQFRHTMRLWATGVTIVTARHNDEFRGLTVSSFTSVTLEPPLILVCVQKTSDTGQLILDSEHFAVSMLGEGQEELSNRFAGYTRLAEGETRFDGIELAFAESGSPIIKEAMAWIDCKLHSVLDSTTHHIFMGEVIAASGQHDEDPLPLLYYNREYHKLG